MTTNTPKTTGSNRGARDVGYAVAGGPASHDLPSFWIALCRYRERHGLTDPQGTQPILDDSELNDLRAKDDARAISFDDDDFAPRR